MIEKYKLFISFALIPLQMSAQQSSHITDHLSPVTLSPQEDRYNAANTDISLNSGRILYANPVFTEWRKSTDSINGQHNAIVYAGMAGSDGKGDFIPYEGNGSTDYRVGAYGEYTLPKSGTLSGCIQYSQGKHHNIGWSAMRLPELYFPYISTDSCGGDFKFDSYYAEGNYAFSLKKWTLGIKGTFYGEQAYRLTDPRALNNTTWLRFNVGVARPIGNHLLMLDAGYGRNKQHMQLRYWRPGQQDRFFVCYGFGLYDTRQSAVSFGKSRMYYIDDFNARLQYLFNAQSPLSIHASLGYSYQHMETEESDIYNLYESRSQQLFPLLRLTYDAINDWQFELFSMGNIVLRKGYENIIEEYLIDRENNIYDFRTIATRQNYNRNTHSWTTAFKVSKRIRSVNIGIQGGISTDGYEEKYASDTYRIKVQTLTPHAKFSAEWHATKDDIAVSLLYAHQSVSDNDYKVGMQNQQIPHLDFQHAFAPYAFRAANLDKVTASITWQHQLKKMAIGLNAKLYIADGNRKKDVAYTGEIGFRSTAPTISTHPDVHKEYWGSITTFVTF